VTGDKVRRNIGLQSTHTQKHTKHITHARQITHIHKDTPTHTNTNTLKEFDKHKKGRFIKKQEIETSRHSHRMGDNGSRERSAKSDNRAPLGISSISLVHCLISSA